MLTPKPLEQLPTEEPKMEPKETKSPAASKTVWGIVAFVVGGLLEAAGLGSADTTQFLADGLQAADIPSLLMLLGGALTAVGIRTADKPIKAKAS